MASQQSNKTSDIAPLLVRGKRKSHTGMPGTGVRKLHRNLELNRSMDQPGGAGVARGNVLANLKAHTLSADLMAMATNGASPECDAYRKIHHITGCAVVELFHTDPANGQRNRMPDRERAGSLLYRQFWSR